MCPEQWETQRGSLIFFVSLLLCKYVPDYVNKALKQMSKQKKKIFLNVQAWFWASVSF